MDLDEMKAVWAAHDANLDRFIRLDTDALRAATEEKTRAALARHAIAKLVELVLSVVAIVLTSAFLVEYVAEPRFLVAASAILIYFVGLVCSLGLQLGLIRRIDYGGSVVQIQRTVERLKWVEYRSLKWALLLGCLFWLLIPIVVAKALAGIDLFAELPAEWLLSNVIFAVAAVGLGTWWSRRFVESEEAGPFARKVLESLSGRGLRSAADFLVQVERFERPDGFERPS